MPPGHVLARRRTLQWHDLSWQSLITLQGQFTDLLVSDVGEVSRAACTRRPSCRGPFMTTALA